MNADELDRCMRTYYKCVYGMALCRCKSPADADDIAQDVFLKLFLYEGTFDSEPQLKAWLMRCTVNHSINLVKSGWHRLSRPLDDVAEIPAPVLDGESGTLLPLILKLGRNNRTALYLYYYERYTVEETARITGVSVTAVRSRLARGRQQLKKLIESERNKENGF